MRWLIAFFCVALIVRRGRAAVLLAFFAAPGARQPARPPSVVSAPLEDGDLAVDPGAVGAELLQCPSK